MAAYRNSVDEGAQPVTVLVARDSLPKGVSGDVIAEKGLFQATGFKRDQVKEGAITDPASLRGQVAVHNLVRGQQLTVADFSRPKNPVLSRLADDQRAMTLPLDAAHGMVGQIQTGDHVDVFAGFQVQPTGSGGRARPVLRVLLQDVEVLQAPPAAEAGRPRQPGRRPRTSCCASATRTRRSWRSRPTTASSGSRCGRPPEPSRTRRRWSRSTGCCWAWTRSRSTAGKRAGLAQLNQGGL